MEQVVAWPGPDGPGYVNLHWKPSESRGHGLRGKPFKDVHEFMDMAQYAATKPSVYKEIYFCLSTQSCTGKVIHGQAIAARSKPTSMRLKAIWIDVDVKPDKGYATLKEALDGIDQFYRAAKLPAPSALVLTGGGVHVYWISDKPLMVPEWRPYAEGLKAEMLRLGLRCDAGLTTDEARILRVPGTFNNKQIPSRPVRLVHLGASYDFKTALAHLSALAPQKAPLAVTAAVSAKTVLPFDLAQFTGRGMNALLAANLPLPQYDSLAEGINLHNDLPLNPDEVFKHCGHFQDSALHHGKDHGQGLWMLTMLASTWFEDGRQWAHYFSKGYPTYTRDETDAMYDRKLREREGTLGWPSCVAFESEGCKSCKTCPYHGKLRSPLNLAERVQPPSITINAAPPPPEDLMLPAGFTVDRETGYICEIVTKDLNNGVDANQLATLFMCQLRKPILQRGSRKIMFETSLDGGTWGPVAIFETDLATEQTLIKSLRSFGVKPYVPNQRRIAHFMTSWTEKLDGAQRRLDTIPFGWLYDKEKGGDVPVGFAYGGRVVRAGGEVQISGFSDQEIEMAYKPVGDGTLWTRACKIITDQNYAPGEAITASGFGAPLMTFCDQYNAILAPWSPESGAGKSTAIQVGASAWGCPKLTKERPLSSQKGILKKLDCIKNLPVFWDEISTEDKMDEIRDMLGMLTEGGGASRLKQSREMFHVEDWQTLMVVASNQSLSDNIMRKTNGTDATLQRIFEFRVARRPSNIPEADVSRLMASLDHNYGHMGLAYGHLLGSDPEGIGKYVRAKRAQFNREVDHSNEERFHSAIATAIFCGAELANQLGCEFHLENLWTWLKEQYFAQRQTVARAEIVGGTAANTLNLLAQVTKALVGNTLWVQSMPSRKKGFPDAIVHLAGPSKDRPAPINIRCSVNDRVIDISKKRLEVELAKLQTTSPLMVIKSMERHYDAKTVHKVDLAVGTGVGGLRETVMRIPVPAGSPFESMLFRQTAITERPVAEEDEAEITDDTITAAVTQARSDLALVQGMTGATNGPIA
jgi:hypothetical protein